ncbi:MAG: DUF5460 family protein [Rickettsia endosymbiont of Oxypoda opaca]|nr:DUF5460 family protein [Rickettsia endosymbiont of Oxypoda opaca]
MFNFSCLLPISTKEIVSNLSANTQQTIHAVGNNIFTSFSNIINNKFYSGYFANNLKCNLKNIIEHLKIVPNDLNAVEKNCGGELVKIEDIFTNNDGQKFLILKQDTTVENGKANILGESYNVTNNVISLNNIANFLGLEDCTTESALRAVQDYLFSLIPTTTTAPSTTNLPDTTIDANNLTEYNLTSNNEDESGTDINPYLIAGATTTAALVVGACIGTAIGYYWGKKNATTILNGEVFNNVDQLSSQQEEEISLTGVGVESEYSTINEL